MEMKENTLEIQFFSKRVGVGAAAFDLMHNYLIVSFKDVERSYKHVINRRNVLWSVNVTLSCTFVVEVSSCRRVKENKLACHNRMIQLVWYFIYASIKGRSLWLMAAYRPQWIDTVKLIVLGRNCVKRCYRYIKTKYRNCSLLYLHNPESTVASYTSHTAHIGSL